MQYELRFPNGDKVSSIDAKQFAELKTAKEGAREYLEHEERFGLLARSLEELEMSALRTAFSAALRKEFQPDSAADVISEFNMRLAALLFASKSYIDQARRWLTKVSTQGTDYLKLFDSARRKEHSELFSYQFMEVFRNHAQHFALPVVGYNISTKAFNGRRVVSCSISLDRDKLLEDGDFKKCAAQLRGQPSRIPLLPYVREYVAALARVHEKIQTGMESYLARFAKAVYGAFIDTGVWDTDMTRDALFAVRLSNEGDEVETLPIVSKTLTRINSLMHAAPRTDLERLAVTTEPLLDAAKLSIPSNKVPRIEP